MSIRPPYAALRVFVEVAERRSVTDAATALGVTPGAVSQQIKSIEDRLGVVLLLRAGGKIDLTAVGRRIVRSLSDSFRDIDTAIDAIDMRVNRRGKVALSTLSSFAALWLAPRLERFYRKYPGIEVSIETTPRVVDLSEEAVDLAIRFGDGNYDGFRSTLLTKARLVPIISVDHPRLRTGILQPAHCLSMPLLHDTEAKDWTRWLSVNGFQMPPDTGGRRFADDLLMIQAVAAGQGIGLIRDIYLLKGTVDPRVHPLLDLSVAADTAFYLVAKERGSHRPEVAAFIRWIEKEAAYDRILHNELADAVSIDAGQRAAMAGAGEILSLAAV